MTNLYLKRDFSINFASPGISSTLIFDFNTDGRGGTAVLNAAIYITCAVVYSDPDGQVGTQTFDAAFRCQSGTTTQIGTTVSIINKFGSGSNVANVSYGFFAGGTQIFFQSDFSASTPSPTFHDFTVEGFLLT